MGFAADVGRFYKNWMKASYETGRRASNRLTRNMDYGKGQKVGAAVDVVAGVGLTGLFGLSTLSYVGAACFAVVGVATASVALPTALLTVAGAVVFGGLGALMTGMGVGFLSAAKDKLHVSTAAAGVGRAASNAAQTLTKPFKWTAHRLSQAFKKAHDDNSHPVSNAAAPKPGQI